MGVLRISLFGKFHVQCGGQDVSAFCAPKVQELFCYLLLHRDRPQSREALASLLWSNGSTTQSKKHLRQALWHLQAALGSQTLRASHLLTAEPEWVQLSTHPSVALDVSEFEQAFAIAQGIPDQEMNDHGAQALQSAIQLYTGDLLEGWYQDWCLYERERLQNMYLMMLDKMMGYCEANCNYDAGLACGALILRYDRAHERTHRRLMRLHFLAGDRTAALRQYERCVVALQEELDVQPARRTVALYEQIRADQLSGVAPTPVVERAMVETANSSLPEVIGRLKQLQSILAEAQRQIQHDIQAVEMIVNGRR